MRQIDLLAGFVALVALGVGAQQAGCVINNYNDCDLYPRAGCPGVGTTSGTGGSANATTNTSTGMGTGGTGGSPIVCDGDPTPAIIENGAVCAVFVEAGAMADGGTGDGSMGHPYATLQTALDMANGKKVFACSPMGKPFTEAVTLSAGLEVYGGFDCSGATWTWAETGRTVLNGPPDKVALTVNKAAANALVSGWAITAAAPSVPMGGGSSIAVAVDDVTVTIERSDVTAADAADGVNGTTPSDVVGIGQDAPMPDHTRLDACINPGQLLGGAPGVTMCGTTTTSGATGGKGGITGTMNGDGQPGDVGANPAASPTAGMDGLGGIAQTGSSAMCTPGDPGAGGDGGGPGNGGSTTGDALTLAGIINSDITDGNPGTSAQGGGGGGGTKSGLFCSGSTDGNGASGGGGGAGGCGGKGGGGGKAGGSSIAIISLGTKLSVVTDDLKDAAKNVTLKAGKGGAGGGGAAGQNGGKGGLGASGGTAATLPPSIDGCNGGNGGKGGPGGPGGGGRGGYSAGIAFAKAPTTALTFKTMPTIGGGGALGISTGNAGVPGPAGAICDFSKASSPCM